MHDDSETAEATSREGAISSESSQFSRAKDLFLEGVERLQHEEYLKAEELFRQSLQLIPSRVSTLTNLCATLIRLNKLEEAIEIVSLVENLDERNPENTLNAGTIAHKQGRLEEALNHFKKATLLAPESTDAWCAKGTALRDLKQHTNSLECFQKSVELSPHFSLGWNNYGVTLQNLGRYPEAMECFDRAIETNPEYADAQYNKALLLLRNKSFRQGFELYSWRWRTESFPSEPLIIDLPFWNMEADQGKRVIIWAEQGLGDEIFYASMIPMLISKKTQISLVADTRLHNIFRRAFPTVSLVDREQPDKQSLEKNHDAHAAVGSLGGLLNLTEQTVRGIRKPYLAADPDRVSGIRKLQVADSKLRCGIAWRSKNKTFGLEKSVELSELEPVLKLSGISFVNLQYGDVSNELWEVEQGLSVRVEDSGIDLFNDIDGLLALIETCDFIVTTSNVTAHLAGSCGKRGVLLVPFGKGKLWFWHEGDEYSLWYPTLRVFHQDNPLTWGSTMNGVANWIQKEKANFR